MYRVEMSGRDTQAEMGLMARIDQVAGVEQKTATKLRKVGVRTSKGLIEEASTRRGRTELSKTTGATPKDLQLWVHHADLLRVRGVGAEYADLLVAAGVDTLRDLSTTKSHRPTGKDHRTKWFGASGEPSPD